MSGIGPAASLALPDAPMQRATAEAAPFLLGEHRVTPRAAFAVDAVVLGAKRYAYGPEAAVSPLDLALGWGPMARPEVRAAIEVSQSGRWYHYRWGAEGPPIAPEVIVLNSGNLHIIPASREVAARLLDLGQGERVRLVGWLVDVRAPDGGTWTTSLRRDDVGDGACEIVYVCDVAAAP